MNCTQCLKYYSSTAQQTMSNTDTLLQSIFNSLAPFLVDSDYVIDENSSKILNTLSLCPKEKTAHEQAIQDKLRISKEKVNCADLTLTALKKDMPDYVGDLEEKEILSNELLEKKNIIEDDTKAISSEVMLKYADKRRYLETE